MDFPRCEGPRAYRDCWFLIEEKTGMPAISDRGTTAFSVERAIKFLTKLSK